MKRTGPRRPQRLRVGGGGGPTSGSDSSFQRQVDSIVDSVKGVTSHKLLGGNYLDGIVLRSDETTWIHHGLGHDYRGFIVLGNSHGHTPMEVFDLHHPRDKFIGLRLPDGPVTDVHAAIREGILSGGLGTTVWLPAGTFVITSSIYLDGVRGMRIVGEGRYTTDIEWAGPASSSAFVLNNCSECSIEHLSVTAGDPLGEAFRLQQGPTGSGEFVMAGLDSSHNFIEHVGIRGQDQLDVGIRVYLYNTGSDARNDHHHFDDIRTAGFKYAAYHLEGRNAKDIKISRAFVQGISPAYESLWGVDTVCRGLEAWRREPGAVEIYNKGASFQFEGQISSCLSGNVRLGDRNDTVTVGPLYSEKSGRLAVIPKYTAGSVGPCSVNFVNVKFAVGDNFASDYEVIQNYSPGPINIFGGVYGRGKDGQQVRFRHEPTPAPSAFNMIGAFVANDGDGRVFPAYAPTHASYTTQNNGFRSGTTGELGSGVVVTTDGPFGWKFPATAAEWSLIGVAEPNSYFTMQGDGIVDPGSPADPETGDPATSASYGEPDKNTSNLRHLTGSGVINYQVTMTDWDYLVSFTETAGENLNFDSTAYDPTADSVAVAWCGYLSASSGNRTLITLGNANNGAGNGGQSVRFDSSGIVELRCDGSGTLGAVDYRNKWIYMALVWNTSSIDYRLHMRATSSAGQQSELIVGTPAGAFTVKNGSSKGIGGVSSITPPLVRNRYLAWWYGDNAETIGSGTLSSLGVTW